MDIGSHLAVSFKPSYSVPTFLFSLLCTSLSLIFSSLAVSSNLNSLHLKEP